MARAHTHCSPRHNSPLGNEDEPAGGAPEASTKDSNIPTPSPPVYRDQTFALAPAPTPVPSATEEVCQQLMKTYAAIVKLLEQNHGSSPCEQPLKARFPDLYYGNLHIDCYRFCQQCEDHFETVGASGPNRIPFTASFLRGSVVQRWHQYKCCSEGVQMSWAEFKDFPRKNLRDDRAFANSICSKFRRDTQYQAEFVLDWAAHLEHLHSILLEYDPVGAPTEPTMLRYFCEGLKSSVLAELEHRNLELESFNQMVKKAVDAEAKSALRPRSSTKEMDQNCPRGNRPANSTVAKSQGSAIKDPRTEEPKVRDTKSLSGPQRSEFSKKVWKEKKKE